MRVRDSLSYVSVALRAPAKAGGTPRPPKFESPELGGTPPKPPEEMTRMKVRERGKERAGESEAAKENRRDLSRR